MIALAFAETSIQLVPDGMLILHIAIILVMVFVLNTTLFKPINRLLEERGKRTRGRSGEAHDILNRVEEKLAHYEQTLRSTRTEGYRLMEQEHSVAMQARPASLKTASEGGNRSHAEHKEIIH